VQAIHPGDILKRPPNGKTIEVNNTDVPKAGCTLADALVYAKRLQPDAVVDLATLIRGLRDCPG